MNTAPDCELNAEADTSFVASIVSAVLGQSPSKTEKLYSDVDRSWYRSSVSGGRSFLVITTSDTSLESEEALVREAGLLGSFQGNPAILHPVGVSKGSGWLGMVLHDPGGNPLGSKLRSEEWVLGNPLEQNLRIAHQLATAVGLIHEGGLIHGDIRPENCFLMDSMQIALTAFRRGRRIGETVAAPSSVVSAAYVSPEEWSSRNPDLRSDLYSLGVALFELFAGSLPFAFSEPLDLAHRHLTVKAPRPSSINVDVPEQIDAIILKLLEKNPDQRYQSAKAATSDLKRCVSDFHLEGAVKRFPIARQDLLLRPQSHATLYGRDVPRQLLLNAAERVAAGGDSEVAIVTGPPGIGKSSLVNDVREVLVGRGFLFAEGKFDQNKWDSPHATIVQAFRGLVRQLLALPETELREWREKFGKALGDNAGVIGHLVPELAHITGQLPGKEAADISVAAQRFRNVFKAFVSVFATEAHPLVIFQDDLQWLDHATLELLQSLTKDQQLRHVLIIVSYRDNAAASPLLQGILSDFRRASRRVTELKLQPLARSELERLLSNVLFCDREKVEELAAIVGEKTGGNPFFVYQFIKKLAADRLLTFSPEVSEWTWINADIRASSITQNVAQLIGLQLDSLPPATKRALQVLSLVGNSTDAKTAALVVDSRDEELEHLLYPAVELGMVRLETRTVNFVHDQIQMSASTSMDEDERERQHLRIGSMLLERTAGALVDDRVYEIAAHFDKATKIIPAEKRADVAGVFLAAGHRAKLASAYSSARSYLSVGMSLLNRKGAETGGLAFRFELSIAECDIAIGDLQEAEERLGRLLQSTTAFADRTDVVSLSVLLYFTTGRNVRAVEIGVEFLVQAGIGWPREPGYDEVVAEYQTLHSVIGDGKIADVFDFPEMTDAKIRSCVAVMTEVFPAAYAVDRRLMEFLLLRMTVLSLTHGLCESSSVAFSALNMVLGVQFGDYGTAYSFGELSRRLVDTGKGDRYKARVYSLFAGFAAP